LPYIRHESIVLAVVDPSVGRDRDIAIRTGDGRLFVGPDNGLLIPAAEKLGGIEAAHEITNEKYVLDHVSATFHGRDVFSPVAAHLVDGVAVEDLGPKLEPESLVRLEVPKPDVTQRRIRASCLYVDRFGNMQLNLTREDLEELAPEPGTRVELEIASERYYAVTARTFADARDGEIIVYEDAYENIAIAISGGSAAGTFFSAQPGVEVRIRMAD
jgi:S-adenosylmethionine hydrolase